MDDESRTNLQNVNHPLLPYPRDTPWDDSDTEWSYDEEDFFDDLRVFENERMAEELAKRAEDRAETEAIKAEMEKALRSDTTVPWMRTKLMVVGEGRAGKSQTVRSILGKSFQESWDSTFGVALSEANAFASSWESVKTGGFALGVAGKIAVEKRNRTDIKDVERLKQRQATPREQQRQQANDDLKMYKIDDVVLKTAKKEQGALRLSIWDYGGQTVFQTLHHLFLTRYGIYVVVFDLTTLMRENPSTEHLIFWYRSLKLHAPEAPALLVGTGLDKFNDEAATVAEAKALLKTHLGSYFTDQSGDSVFLISNKDKRGIPMLQLAIKTIAEDQDFVYKEVSVKWMRCLDTIMESRQHIKFSEVVDEARKLDIKTKAEVTAMLAMSHEFGVLLYFRSTEILSETVIVDPQWLVDAISKVIRDPNIHNFDNKDLEIVGLVQDAQQLFQSGIASRDLLEYLWNQDEVNYLLDLMQKLLLLSPWGYGEAEGEAYLFPSMIVKPDVESVTAPAAKYRFEFEYLPNGIFERLVCLFCMYGNEGAATQSPRLYKDSARLSLGGDVQIRIHQLPGNQLIELSVSHASAAGKTMYTVDRMLAKIRDDLVGDRLAWSKTVQKGDKFVPVVKKKRKQGSKDNALNVDAFLKANF